MQVGDALAITFSEAILASSVPGTTTITETDPTGGGNDTLTITGLTNGARCARRQQLRGHEQHERVVRVEHARGRRCHVTATVAGACAGIGCGTISPPGQGAFVFAPAATITDAAGNGAAATALTTTGFRVF